MQFEDMAEFELNIQLDRLKYIDTLLNKKTYCNFPPRKLYIEPTNICNLKCIHCVHNGAMTRKPEYFDFNLFKNIIDQINYLRLHTKIQFTGVGEPFFHKRIFDMIEYASERGFFTLMNTNATMLTKEMAIRTIESGLDYIHISLDGLTRKTYESIRIGADFYKVVENIFNLFEAKYNKKGYHLAVVLGIIDQKRNSKEIELFEKYFAKYPFHHVVVGELFNHMGAIEEANLTYKDKKNLSRKEYSICNTPWDLISFNCDGKAVACNYDFDNRFVIGDAAKENAMDIWNGPQMQFFRKSVLESNYKDIEKNGSLCSECTIKWQKDYQIPKDFYSEVARMEEYLVRAIRRSSGHRERNAEFRQKEERLLQHKDELIAELKSFEA
ncbi:MAG: radical SAM/SPASM domain-containing protein [Thermodesulfobacteriota bacterium]|nr:radical SAM/SPASM domain-containing protein [Thermodesulfobacteriota bacterium]